MPTAPLFWSLSIGHKFSDSESIHIFSLVILLLRIRMPQGPVWQQLVAWQHLQCVPSRSLLRTGDGKAGIAAALGVSFGTNHSRHAQGWGAVEAIFAAGRCGFKLITHNPASSSRPSCAKCHRWVMDTRAPRGARPSRGDCGRLPDGRIAETGATTAGAATQTRKHRSPWHCRNTECAGPSESSCWRSSRSKAAFWGVFANGALPARWSGSPWNCRNTAWAGPSESSCWKSSSSKAEFGGVFANGALPVRWSGSPWHCRDTACAGPSESSCWRFSRSKAAFGVVFANEALPVRWSGSPWHCRNTACAGPSEWSCWRSSRSTAVLFGALANESGPESGAVPPLGSGCFFVNCQFLFEQS